MFHVLHIYRLWESVFFWNWGSFFGNSCYGFQFGLSQKLDFLRLVHPSKIWNFCIFCIGTFSFSFFYLLDFIASSIVFFLFFWSLAFCSIAVMVLEMSTFFFFPSLSLDCLSVAVKNFGVRCFSLKCRISTSASTSISFSHTIMETSFRLFNLQRVSLAFVYDPLS